MNILEKLEPADKTQKNVVYCAVNRLNKKVYIGYTQKTLFRRISCHLCKAKRKNNSFFHNAIAKYGLDGFDWYILFQSSNLEELKSNESAFIKLLNSNHRDFGYNLSTGGESPQFNEESCRKISEKAKERDLRGERNPFFGKKHNKETKDYLSKINKGNNWGYGYRHSEEDKKKMSEIKKEVCKKPEVILNLRLAQKSKPIICLTNNTQYISISDAARQLGVGKSGITGQLHGRSKTYKGLTFKFI